MLAIAMILIAVCSAMDADYKQRVFHFPLDAKGTATFSWTIDYEERLLHIEVHATLDERSWFAVGFSDYGETFPADYCVIWQDWKGVTHFEDTWAGEDGRLWVDQQQDCRNFRFVRRHNVTKYTFTRGFDTCDEQDYIIEEGTTHVVWLRGSGPLFRLDGLDVSSASHHGLQRSQLLKNVNPVPELPPDTWAHEVLAKGVRVPSVDTTYWCQMHLLPPQLSARHHIVQFEAVIQEGNEGLVHHMEVFHCEAPASTHMPDYNGPCSAPDRPEVTNVCKRVLAAWAMGALPFVYPEEAGLPIGGPDFNRYVVLEVHYNNPELRSDWVDSSGMRLHVSSTLRQFDSGVIELGLEYTDKMAIPPGQTDFMLSGFCVTECTAVGVPLGGITVFGSQLHTHLTGVQVSTRHIRDGRELLELNRDNHYSQHYQEIRSLKRQVKVLPGDALITSCAYRTTSRQNVTMGGFAITDEMCVNYIYYYPKTELEVCKSSISYESLFTYFRFLREWENQGTSTELGISANYGEVEWSPIRVDVLQQLYNESPLSMQCNMSTGDRFPGYWENIPVTPVLFPMPPPARRPCDNRGY